MKRLASLLAAIALLGAVSPARAQLPPSEKLIINQTGIQGGSNGQCLLISSAKLGSQACGGTGTVTSVSVTTANGISGSVATATTTPAITLALGAITPTTVNGNTITTGTGVLTLGAGKTATISNTLTFTGTDGSSVDFGAGGTVVYNSTVIPPASGGTGISSYAVGDLLYASGATTLSKLADVAIGQPLISGGVGVAPGYSGSWVKFDTSGTLLTVSRNATAWTPAGTTGFHVAGANAGEARIQVTAANSDGVLVAARMDGTFAAPTHLLADEQIVGLVGVGIDTDASTTMQQGGTIGGFSGGAWTSTSHPFYWDIFTIASGSTSFNAVSRFGMSGGLSVGAALDMPTGVISAAVGFRGGTYTGTSTSTTAMTVGRQGATNPAFQVDSSNVLGVTGLKVQSLIAGNGVGLTALSSGTNEPLYIDAKGSGTINIGVASSTGAVNISQTGVATNVLGTLAVTGAAVLSTSVTSPLAYGGSVAGSTLTVNGTSNGSPSSAYLILQGNGQNTGVGGQSAPSALLHVGAGNDVSSLFPQFYVSAAGRTAFAVRDSTNDIEFGMFTNHTPDVVAMGTNTSHPLWIQTNASNIAAFHVSSGFSVGNTTDPGAGKISATGGFVANGVAGVTKTCTEAVGQVLTFTLGILTGTTGAGCV